MKHIPSRSTRDQVEVMAEFGVTEFGIARALEIDPKTLRKHYRDQLDAGHLRATTAVAQSLFRKATGNHPQAVVAAIFWLRCRAGWQDTAPEWGADGA